jgi:hypothetical protein
MKVLKLLTIPLLAIVMGLSGCVMIESSAITGGSGSGKSVTTSASDFGILYLTLPDGLTSKANSQLAGQCQSAKLTNVQTELSMRNFILAQVYDVTVSGQCE